MTAGLREAVASAARTLAEHWADPADGAPITLPAQVDDPQIDAEAVREASWERVAGLSSRAWAPTASCAASAGIVPAAASALPPASATLAANAAHSAP